MSKKPLAANELLSVSIRHDVNTISLSGNEPITELGAVGVRRLNRYPWPIKRY